MPTTDGRPIVMRDLTVVVPASLPDNQGSGIQVGGDTLEGVDVGEWTDSFYFVPPSENRALGVNDEGGATSFITTSFLPYRCVTQLVR